MQRTIESPRKLTPLCWFLPAAMSLCLSLIPALAGAESAAKKSDPSGAKSLDSAQFAAPEAQYRPIDCWWWDGAPLDRERLRFQLEDMHAKGVGGTWLYPRFHHSQPMSSDPGFWTDGWWEFVKFVLDEHQRLGMVQWANDWIGRFDKNHFQNQLIGERDQNPALIGHRLVFHRADSTEQELVRVVVPQGQTIVTASAYKRQAGTTKAVDGETRIELAGAIFGQEVRWKAPEKDWSVIVVAKERHGLDYIGPEVAKRWNEIFFDKYRQRLGDRLGKSLVAYGPDERFVLNGNILYSDELRLQITRKKGYDPIGDLPALFVDVGARTDKVRCDYYDVMVFLLEKNFYQPVLQWLHDHDMQQATIATWGRENLLGQVFNYGDFFRMMRHFDITGNEDSIESGPAGAFIDSKLSSSIAHLNGRSRVAVCSYWGTGWGFTQEQNIARTNVNYALGINLLNTHGVLYSFMGGRNEFVPPEVHFYQPYWQTWRTHYDYVTRLSYALSQGHHRADAAIVYPVSTLHAQWHGGSKFGSPARAAQQSMFALAKTIYSSAIDFDFIDEVSIAKAKLGEGKLKPAMLEFSAVVLPPMSTIRTDAAKQLKEFVSQGGTLLVQGGPPTASAERGREDETLRQIWEELLGNYASFREPVTTKSHESGGRAILVRASEAEAASALRAAIRPDVQLSEPEVIHTHQQAGDQHLYFFVNRRPEKRRIEATVRARGTPEIWDASTGEVRPLHRFHSLDDGTRLQLEMAPYAGVLVVLQPAGKQPEVVEDNLASIESVNPAASGYEVVGTADVDGEAFVKVAAAGRTFIGRGERVTPLKALALDGLWDCEYQPTMDNRWGDFRYPAKGECIGPEMPRMKYRAEPPALATRPAWQAADLADDDWRDVTCTYGPYWQVLGPVDERLDSEKLTEQLLTASDGEATVALGSKHYTWEPYSYSQKFGADRRDVHSTNDGICGVSPDFLVFDRPTNGRSAACYLRTQVISPREQELYLHFGNAGDYAPRKAWVNGQLIVQIGEGEESLSPKKVILQKGSNALLLRIAMPNVQAPTRKRNKTADERASPTPSVTNTRVATFAVFLDSPNAPEPPRYLPISRWYETTADVVYDCRPADQSSIGWYRFSAPPGARSAQLSLDAESVEGWVNGERCEIVDGVLAFPSTAIADGEASKVALRVKNRRGAYEGATFREPISFICGRGRIRLGDWSKAGLQYYSGGVTYLSKVHLTEAQIAHQVLLDLGDVRTSAEVTVNGRPLGVRLARPFVFDLSKSVQAGENEIRVNVLNTLANYMSAQPSRFVFDGQTVSGLLGPAKLYFPARVTVRCAAATTAENR